MRFRYERHRIAATNAVSVQPLATRWSIFTTLNDRHGARGGMMTDLVYNIAEESLRGAIDATIIQAHAVSGGRGGSTTPGAENLRLKNNAFAIQVSSDKSGQFGPLPIGIYKMIPHPDHARWVRLLPEKENIMFHRAGFAIHPRGPLGSHGCIVPDDARIVDRILVALKHRAMHGGASPTIKVEAVGFDLDRKLFLA